MWKLYRSLFINIPNFGFYTMISALVRLGDIGGAETIYKEWLSVKSMYDPRIANLLLDWYVKEGFSDKAGVFYDEMIKGGGKPNSRTWEILAEDHIRERRISESVQCLKNAVSTEGSGKWMPKRSNLSLILKLCEEEGDMTSKEAALGLLKQINFLQDENHMSGILIQDGAYSGGETSVTDFAQDDVDSGNKILLNELQGSL